MINPRSTRRRLALSVLLVFAIVAGLGFRLVDIQVVRAEEISAGASDHRSRQVTVYGTRGSIVDASGVVLADSVQRFDITASPRNVDFVTTSILRDDDGDGESERVTVPTSEAIEAIAAITGDDAAEMMQRHLQLLLVLHFHHHGLPLQPQPRIRKGDVERVEQLLHAPSSSRTLPAA